MRTPAQLRRKYTRTVKLGGRWYTYLQVGVQGFCVVEKTTKRRAEWFAKMLSRALANLIRENQP